MKSKCMRNYRPLPTVYGRHPCTGGTFCKGDCQPQHPRRDKRYLGKTAYVIRGPLAERSGKIVGFRGDKEPGVPYIQVAISGLHVETIPADSLAV